MKNLELFKLERLSLGDVQGQVVYYRNEDIYFFRENAIYVANRANVQQVTLKVNIDKLVYYQYLSADQRLLIVASNSLFVLDPDNGEVVQTSFHNRIEAFLINPTQDTIALVTAKGNVKVYQFDTTSWELVEQGCGSLYDIVAETDKVGWGSAETQFRGPRNRPTVITEDEKVSTDLPDNPEDDQLPKLTWRDNGDTFAASYWTNDARHIKVFDLTGKALYEMEPLKCLQPSIAWKPECHTVAGIVWLQKEYSLVLFERNGEVKAVFPISDLECPIIELNWSPCGNVLAVIHNEEFAKHVCLYTITNSRLYLKQHISFKNTDELLAFDWTHSNYFSCEFVAITAKQVTTYKFKYKIHVSNTHEHIAVVNGKKLYLTKVRGGVVPPPMSTHTIDYDQNINFVTCHPTEPKAAVVDVSNNLYVYEIESDIWRPLYTTRLLQDAQKCPMQLHHFYWTKQSLCFISERNLNESDIYEFDTVRKSVNIIRTLTTDKRPIEHIQHCDSALIVHSFDERTVVENEEDEITPALSAVYLQMVEFDGIRYSFALTSTKDLYLNEKLICGSTTSFLFFERYFMFTQDQTLYSIRIDPENLKKVLENGSGEFVSRRINESVSLVNVVPDSGTVVLETPRGNFELVFCRLIDVDNLERLLENRAWTEALKYIRMSKLDWNLLIDLNPERFFENVPEIVRASKKNVLSAMCAQIDDQNVLESAYRKCFSGETVSCENKCEKFFDGLMTYLEDSGLYVDHIQTVIYVSIRRYSLSRALTYMRDLLEQLRDGKPGASSKCYDGVTALRKCASDDQLFKEALLLYDLDLAEYLAGYCQLDPKVYEPLLEHLRPLDEIELRFQINMKYEKYDEAVAFLMRKRYVSDDEVLAFIRNNDISERAHRESLVLDLSYSDEIAELYAEFLRRKAKYNEAALVMLRRRLHAGAVPYLVLGLDWERLVTSLPLSGFSTEDCRIHANDIANRLAIAGRYKEAATVYEKYADNPSKAIQTLTDGKVYADAVRLAKEKDLQSVGIVLETTKGYFKHIVWDCGFIGKMTSMITKRLINLRDKKRKFNQERTRDAMHSANIDQNFDLVSEAGSRISRGLSGFESDSRTSIGSGGASSRTSGSSRASSFSKRMRREERKKQDTREGSEYEDIALVRELHIDITRLFKHGPDIRMCLEMFIENGNLSVYCLKTQQEFVLEVQNAVTEAIPQIWSEDFYLGSPVTHVAENIHILDEIFRTPPPEVNTIGTSWQVQMLL